MKIALASIPQAIILKNILNDEIRTLTNQILMKIKKEMYVLKQAAVLAYNHLVKNSGTHEYHSVPHTVGLWTETLSKKYEVLFVCR